MPLKKPAAAPDNGSKGGVYQSPPLQPMFSELSPTAFSDFELHEDLPLSEVQLRRLQEENAQLKAENSSLKQKIAACLLALQ